ncbi:twin-arginine translocation signal domain-containing protein [Novipirellula artificiosorum]|uniref:Uncharacterized protein n=1 Tax=Novipirellula artificiosorum TaxID=2528016 RepID=A0A5C6DUM4_9BACT|nr:twin-arginine translocation signal domain-containing protein [Novipirellula artificiosorum]TWU39617.1 hypothetical protein Poly41_24720 [Novipirellula artificiosorum]
MQNQAKSRRHFLKTSLAGSAAASVPYFFSRTRTLAQETKSKNDRMTVGVIGAGGIAGLARHPRWTIAT